MLSTITIAALSGTTQLLTLCLTGAYLSRLNILTPSLTRSLSSSIYNAFLPALLFSSTFILPRTVTNASTIIVPPAWALLTMALSAVTAAPVALLTQPPIRRTVFVALLLGNANNLPLLLLHALCDDLPLGPGCHARGDSYVALYLTTWNTFMWTVILQFLCGTPDDTLPGDVVQLRGVEDLEHPGGETVPTGEEIQAGVRTKGLWKVFSPPFIAILTGGVLGVVPYVADIIHTYFAPFLHAMRLLADVVVPLSSIIVGSRLYSHTFRETKEPPLKPFLVVSVIITRFVLLPMVGRLVYKLFKLGELGDPLLKIYLLIPWFMPTASNSVVMVQMAAALLPNIGERMEGALLVIIFWEYVVTPVFLTLNMAVGLGVVQENGGFGE